MSGHPTARFGEKRLLRTRSEALFYRFFGAADPAHWLHHRYLRRALDRRPALNPRAILDGGSGPGDHLLYLARRFPKATVVGVDLRKDWIAETRQAARDLGIGNVRVATADLRALRRREGFDLVCAIDVLEHIPEQLDVLHFLHAALRPGGLAFFHLPTARMAAPLWRFLGAVDEWARDEHMAAALSPEAFRDLLLRAGFQIEAEVPTFGYWTGELATSLFNLPYRPSRRNRILQAGLTPFCKALAALDPYAGGKRFAIAVEATKPRHGRARGAPC